MSLELRGKIKQQHKQQKGYFGMYVMQACSANYIMKTIFVTKFCFKRRENIQLKSISKVNRYQMHDMHLYKRYMYKFTTIYLHLQ